MFHHVARSVPERLLWSHDLDGLALFLGLCRAFPDLTALCVMPDHLHLVLPHADPDRKLHRALAGYAHGLCVRRGLRGPLFAPRPDPQPLPDDKHVRRTVRYIHLNPCRAHLARDPLAWPFSTHRDHTGFAAVPQAPVAGRPAAFHRYVSSDPTVHVAGTALPEASTQPVALPRLASAVASVFRTTEDALFTRSAARMALVRAAAWYEINPSEVRRFTGLSYPAWHRLTASAPTRGGYVQGPVLVACLSAAADPRFTALSTTDRRSERAWARYALRR